MIKDMLKDIVKDLLKFLAGLVVPVCMMFVGAALVGIGFHFEVSILLVVGGVIALCGLLWAVFLVLFASHA